MERLNYSISPRSFYISYQLRHGQINLFSGGWEERQGVVPSRGGEERKKEGGNVAQGHGHGGEEVGVEKRESLTPSLSCQLKSLLFSCH